MITFDDVTLTHPDGAGRVTALDHVHLVVPDGAVTVLTGPSGSGKSSLLAVAAGLVRPDSGRVLLDDDDVARLAPSAAAALRRERVGVVFQQANLLPSLTVRDQLLVMGELGAVAGGRGQRRRELREHADALLAEVGLDGLGRRRPHQLSGGQRQRVAIARALVHAPSVLLVDEPTSALDSERAAEVVELLVRLTRERGTATLLVTHDLDRLNSVPGLERVVRMSDGRLDVPALR
ncbi:putative ABC transport system ATP-binding protein [Quadrisphaera granulorum]|uniref:Putative ABC transport system ATP-binding protein n=1 Tax=Quadrisphaera granulorum TaxID=317664 RepID=A0A316A7U3_9ACTN|nr:ABC transporter ATP-binding protein [Quadrisphaera granulorum]PWJ53996.1 putative ABC transport system ATP-binding protein [Quadrisphaera granulorum]SZE96453.1 putative ABC transport system ATP-binding protein [Quadrisphaera granulorum]